MAIFMPHCLDLLMFLQRGSANALRFVPGWHRAAAYNKMVRLHHILIGCGNVTLNCGHSREKKTHTTKSQSLAVRVLMLRFPESSLLQSPPSNEWKDKGRGSCTTLKTFVWVSFLIQLFVVVAAELCFSSSPFPSKCCSQIFTSSASKRARFSSVTAAIKGSIC